MKNQPVFLFLFFKNQISSYNFVDIFCTILRAFCLCNEGLETHFNFFLGQVGALGLGLEPTLVFGT